jgi:hypothetical protein
LDVKIQGGKGREKAKAEAEAEEESLPAEGMVLGSWFLVLMPWRSAEESDEKEETEEEEERRKAEAEEEEESSQSSVLSSRLPHGSSIFCRWLSQSLRSSEGAGAIHGTMKYSASLDFIAS